MANILISSSNAADDGDLSGGSWTFSLDNLQNRHLSKAAVSSNASAANTIIDCDLGSDAGSVRVVALAAHNLSADAQIKVQLRSGASGGGALVAGHTDFVDVWPTMYAGTPDRKPTQAEIAWLPKLYIYDLGSDYAARYLRIEISDEDNPDGVVSIGRLWAGPGWQPTRNFAYGAEVGVLDDTPVEESPAGAEFTGTVKRRRTARCSLDWLTMDEGFQSALDMANALGRTGQMLVCLDPSDPLNLFRQSMLCTMEASALGLPQYDLSSMSFEFREVIA